MKVGIYGVTKAGSFVREIIEKIYNPEAEKFGAEPLQVCCYIDVNHSGLLEYDGIMTMQIQEFLKYYFYDVIPTIIVPREIFHFGQPQLALKGIGFNLDDIYMAGRLNKEMLARTAPLDFLMPYLDSDYLPYLEFHIADKCNLNCAACQHFAGLVKEEHFPDFEKFKEGFTKLHSFVSDIGRDSDIRWRAAIKSGCFRICEVCKVSLYLFRTLCCYEWHSSRVYAGKFL